MEKISNKKKVTFTIIFILLILLPFILAEIYLNISDKGYDTNPFKINRDIKGFLVDNPEYLTKFYTTGEIKSSKSKNFFPSTKTEKSLRGFVIGGSTAEGYPYPSNQSFSKILEAQLVATKRYDNVNIINLGFSAMSSFYVKDTVKKILEYDPDFIIVYSGHNEYYGTISATTGGTFFLKNLYLNLKELKIFQVLYSLKGGKKDQTLETNLMEKQFNNNEIDNNSIYNNIASEHYSKNIKKIIEITNKNEIPTFFIEPISNLIDMPPFASEMGDLDKEIYLKIKSAYDKNNLVDLKSLISDNRSHIEKTDSALLLYFTGLSKIKLEDDDYLYYLKKAKDFDKIPFRAKTHIINTLIEANITDNDLINFIPLSNILENRFGDGIFSNKIFIDHLHFNINGQKVVGEILAESLGYYYSFSEKEMSSMKDLMNTDVELKKIMHFNDFAEVIPYWTVSSIINSHPYSDMSVKFKMPEISTLFPNNKFAVDDTFQQKMFSEVRNVSDIIEYIYLYYMKNDLQECQSFINYMLFNYPGSPAGYVMTAEYYSLFEPNEIIVKKIVDSYFKALFLTDYDDNIYNKFRSYLNESNQVDIIKQLDFMYAENKRG